MLKSKSHAAETDQPAHHPVAEEQSAEIEHPPESGADRTTEPAAQPIPVGPWAAIRPTNQAHATHEQELIRHAEVCRPGPSKGGLRPPPAAGQGGGALTAARQQSIAAASSESKRRSDMRKIWSAHC